MSEQLKLVLTSRQQAWAAVKGLLFPAIGAAMQSGRRWVLTLRPEVRSHDQNALLHALIGEIARQAEWAGRKWDAEVWKRLLVAAWTRARGEQVVVLPALDGHGVDMVPARTSRLSRRECAELIDFIAAWAAEHGIAVGDALQAVREQDGSAQDIACGGEGDAPPPVPGVRVPMHHSGVGA